MSWEYYHNIAVPLQPLNTIFLWRPIRHPLDHLCRLGVSNFQLLWLRIIYFYWKLQRLRNWKDPSNEEWKSRIRYVTSTYSCPASVERPLKNYFVVFSSSQKICWPLAVWWIFPADSHVLLPLPTPSKTIHIRNNPSIWRQVISFKRIFSLHKSEWRDLPQRLLNLDHSVQNGLPLGKLGRRGHHPVTVPEEHQMLLSLRLSVVF